MHRTRAGLEFLPIILMRSPFWGHQDDEHNQQPRSRHASSHLPTTLASATSPVWVAKLTS